MGELGQKQTKSTNDKVKKKLAYNHNYYSIAKRGELRSVTWKAHLKMMQSFFLHNYFSIIQVMELNKEKS